MNAAEARKQRQAAKQRSLSQRLRADAAMAREIDARREELRLEQQFLDAMHAQHITGAELARRTKAKPASISRDLAGGLSAAKLGRVRRLADAIGCDVITLLVPRDPNARKRAISTLSHRLIDRD